MRILHILSQLELTGAEVYAQHLIEEQIKEGHEVYVISDKIHVPIKALFQSLPISENSKKARLSNQNLVRAHLKEKKIEVIHCHSRAAVRVAFVARHDLGIGMVSTIHGRQHASLGKRFTDSYGEYKILICENLQKQFETDLRSEPGSTKIIRNPFRFDMKTPAHLPSRPKTITFIGRTSGPKGDRFKDLFNKVLANLLQEQPELQLHIISSLPERLGESFHRVLRPFEFKGQVKIFKQTGPLPLYIYHPDNLIIGAGRVAIEAMILGCSVFSFGEHAALGIVSLENLDQNLKSNFGDIGEENSPEPLRVEFAREQILSWLSGSSDANPQAHQKILQSLEMQFEIKKIYAKIIELYKSAIFKVKVPMGIPVLMYHRISDLKLDSPHKIFVDKKTFESHLQFFKRQGFHTLHFKEIVDFWNVPQFENRFPSRPLLLTFDDGYRDNLKNMAPLLAKYNLKGNVFLLSDTTIKSNEWDDPKSGTDAFADLLNPVERRELASMKQIEIGSHGLTHASLLEESTNVVLETLKNSRQQLETEFQRPILAFAFTFGQRPRNASEMAREGGYELAFNTDSGGIHFADDRFSIFRVNVFPTDGLFAIWKKTRAWYRRRFYLKHAK